MPRGKYPRKKFNLPRAMEEHSVPITVPSSSHMQAIVDGAGTQGYDWCEVTVDYFKEGKRVRQMRRQEGWRRP